MYLSIARHSTCGMSESELSESCLLHAPLFTILVRENVVFVTCSVISSLSSSCLLFMIFTAFFDFPGPDWFFFHFTAFSEWIFELFVQLFISEFMTDCLVREILFGVFCSFLRTWVLTVFVPVELCLVLNKLVAIATVWWVVFTVANIVFYSRMF